MLFATYKDVVDEGEQNYDLRTTAHEVNLSNVGFVPFIIREGETPKIMMPAAKVMKGLNHGFGILATVRLMKR